MRILLAQDDAVERLVLASIIREAGHTVAEARDGETAWRILRREKINFVVTDWMLPGLSGIELCRRIRSSVSDRYVYVMFCTSKAMTSDLIRGMDAGADAFVTKPVSADELRVRIGAGKRVLDVERRLAEKNRDLELSNERLRTAYERIETDLRAAAWVQEGLLPSPEMNALGVACNWRYRPSSYMAGDMLNFFAVDERHVGFYLLDVSGHGVPAAMFSVALSMMLSPDATHGSPFRRIAPGGHTFEVTPPMEVMAELNRRFQSRGDRYFTMSYGLLDSEASLLRLAQAGNPNPVLIESGGRVKELTTGGMPVGLWPDMDLDCIEVPFEPGDRLVLYSDGITECTNVRDEEYGDERLLEYFTDSASQSLDNILNGLERQLEDWRGSAEFSDDVSLLAVELTSQEKQLQ